MTTTMHTTSRALRRSALDRPVAMKLAATEYERVADAIAALDPEDWSSPTDCPAWDVRQLVAHVVGMATMVTGFRELGRQTKLAGAEVAAHGGDFIDALTALQVRERADFTPARLVEAVRAVGPRAARGRKRFPGVVRRRELPQAQHVNGEDEYWAIGYLIDTILTRDPWMHRIDLAQATGRELVLTADHDGVIVDDVVTEWAGRHGRPFTLTLTGPAGGTWGQGEGGDYLTMDAIEFCRVLSGRVPGPGLLSFSVPF
jgi:uncharacterized protein (TIGR03083 family)